MALDTGETMEMIGQITGGLVAGAGLVAAIHKFKGPKDKSELLKNLDATLTEMYNKLQIEREEKSILAEKVIELEHELKECKEK